MPEYKYQRAVLKKGLPEFIGKTLWTRIERPQEEIRREAYLGRKWKKISCVSIPYISRGEMMVVSVKAIELLGGEENFAEEVAIEPWADFCRREGLPVPGEAL